MDNYTGVRTYISKTFGSTQAIEMFDRQFGLWLFCQRNDQKYYVTKIPPKYQNHFCITIQLCEPFKVSEAAGEVLSKQIYACYEALREKERISTFFEIKPNLDPDDNTFSFDINFYKE